PIHLVLTDILMPKRRGDSAVKVIRSHRPLISAIYISGYADDDVAEEPDAILYKPFGFPDLGRRSVRYWMPLRQAVLATSIQLPTDVVLPAYFPTSSSLDNCCNWRHPPKSNNWYRNQTLIAQAGFSRAQSQCSQLTPKSPARIFTHRNSAHENRLYEISNDCPHQ